MQKVCKALGAVVGKVLFVGFVVQIVLGICWMVMNFPYIQNFGESALYVEISKTLICDEYEGILYPVLILLARGIEEIFPIPYHCIMYLLQLSVAFTAGYRFLKVVGLKGKAQRIFGAFALLTFPMAMQCHLAVLPDSLVASCMLLLLTFGLQILLGGQSFSATEFAKVLTFWLLTALLQPEYLYLGAVPVAVLLMYGIAKAWKNSAKRILYYVILIGAFAGMILSVESLTQVEGYYGRTHRSLNSALASRFTWSRVCREYELWPEEVKQCLTWEEALHIDYYADHMDRILGRTLEAKLGVERAEELLGEIARIGWRQHRHIILHDIGWDVVGYTVSPMVIQRQLMGKAYDSYTGRNYDIMRAETPLIATYYLNYGCWWFAVGFVVVIFVQLLILLHEKRSFWKAGMVTALFGWMLTVCGVVVYYTMRGAGMMDYKKGLLVTLLWIVWMVRYAGTSSIVVRNNIAGDTHPRG